MWKQIFKYPAFDGKVKMYTLLTFSISVIINCWKQMVWNSVWSFWGTFMVRNHADMTGCLFSVHSLYTMHAPAYVKFWIFPLVRDKLYLQSVASFLASFQSVFHELLSQLQSVCLLTFKYQPQSLTDCVWRALLLWG